MSAYGGGVCPVGVSAQGVSVPLHDGGAHPHVYRITDRCKNITLLQPSFAGNKKKAFQ